MDGELKVGGSRGHFDGEYAFGNQFARACNDDSHAQYALGLRIEEEFSHAFGAIDGHGAPRGSPGKFCDFDFALVFLGLGFGEAAPGDFGISEDDSGDCIRFESDFVSGDGFDCGATFMRRFVRQHGFADYVTDGVDRWVGGPELLVDLDESTSAELDLRLVQAWDF